MNIKLSNRNSVKKEDNKRKVEYKRSEKHFKISTLCPILFLFESFCSSVGSLSYAWVEYYTVEKDSTVMIAYHCLLSLSLYTGWGFSFPMSFITSWALYFLFFLFCVRVVKRGLATDFITMLHFEVILSHCLALKSCWHLMENFTKKNPKKPHSARDRGTGKAFP